MTTDERERRNWVRPPWVVVVLPIVVIAALIPSAFYADERWKVYRDAVWYEGNLIAIVRDVFSEFESYINFGNFRPFARIVDRFEHTLAFEVSLATGFPPHIAHGFFRVLAVVALSVTAWWLVRSVERGPDQDRDGVGPATVLFPVILAGSMIGLTTQSPIILFPFLYLVSSAIVLMVAAWLIRDTNRTAEGIGVWGIGGYAVVGAVLATFNEITYLAVPIALVVIVMWWWIHHPDVALWKLRASRAWAWMTGGFLLLFVPIRLIIANSCADGTCYANSDLSFGAEAIRLWFDRVIDSFFIFGWARAAIGVRGKLNVPDVTVLITSIAVFAGLVVCVVAAVMVARRLSRMAPTDGWRLPVGLGLTGLGIAGIAGMISALSVRLQEINIQLGTPWRESGLSMVGWALIITALLLPLRRWTLLREGVGVVIVSVGLAGFLAGSLYANTAAGAHMRQNNQESIHHNLVSENMVTFSRTDNGNALRCDLVAELDAIYEAKGNTFDKTLEWIDAASFLANGEPFCSE